MDEKKYTDARYPDKINDLVDNDGNLNPEATGDFATKEYVNEAVEAAVNGLLSEEF